MRRRGRLVQTDVIRTKQNQTLRKYVALSISSPERCASLDDNHSIKLLAFGDLCLRRGSVPRRLCALIYRSLFLSLSFRVIAHLFHTALSRVGYLLSRRNLPYCPHSKQLRCQRWSEWYRLRLPLFRLSARANPYKLAIALLVFALVAQS
jgi:hypothetical protein